MGFRSIKQVRVVHRHQVDEDDVSRAKAEFAEQLDIRAVANRYLKTGYAPQSTVQPAYGDFSNVFDYLEAVNQIRQAEAQYEALPMQIRDRFAGVAGLLEFCDDDANLAESVALGLVTIDEAEARGWIAPEPEVPVKPAAGDPPSPNPPE